MRLGLLGSGMMGRQHLSALATLPDVTVVTRSSEPYVSTVFSDRESFYRTVIASPDLDAIDICLPTRMHPWVAIAALEAGKHVICEKPLALNLSECSRILDAARNSGRIFMMAHVVRFFPAYRMLAQAIRNQQFGPLRSIHFKRWSAIPAWSDWLACQTESGGAILDLLIHDFDQSIWLLGMPNRVFAEPIESENTVRCVMQYDASASRPTCTVEIEGGWFSDERPFAMSFHAHFSQADLTYCDNQLTVQSGSYTASVPLTQVDPYAEQLRYFLSCCRNHSEPAESSARAGADAVRLALTIRALAHSMPGVFTPFPHEEDSDLVLEQ
jgi:predicted dehydrogenase